MKKPRFYIRLKEKTTLPMKWFFKKRKNIKNIDVRPKREIYQKIQELEKELLLAEREDKRDSIIKYESQLAVIDWMLCHTTESN